VRRRNRNRAFVIMLLQAGETARRREAPGSPSCEDYLYLGAVQLPQAQGYVQSAFFFALSGM